jgi:hypothetical protein
MWMCVLLVSIGVGQCMGVCFSKTTAAVLSLPMSNEPFAGPINQTVEAVAEQLIVEAVEEALGESAPSVTGTSPSSPTQPLPLNEASPAASPGTAAAATRTSRIGILVHAFFVFLSALLYAYHPQIAASVQ